MKKNIIPTNLKKNQKIPLIVKKPVQNVVQTKDKKVELVQKDQKKDVLVQNVVQTKDKKVELVQNEQVKDVLVQNVVQNIDKKEELVQNEQISDKKKERRKRLGEEEMRKKKEMGQYNTISGLLQNKVLEFIRNKSERILEPSVGRGDLVIPIMNKYSGVKFDMYEIDSGLEKLVDGIVNCDFLEMNVDRSYGTIVGNPPFVKTKRGNLAIDFVEKCFGLLESNGELIFVVPADFFKLTSTGKLLNNMMSMGTFTDIFHPEEENLFEDANINVLIFRYCKNTKLPKICEYNGISKKIVNNNGLLIFMDEVSKLDLFENHFDIYVGLVSGRDEIYKKEMGNIEVLVEKGRYERFIYSKVFPTPREEVNKYLLENKEELIGRRIRKFNEDNWFEWGAPRNVGVMEQNVGKKCIYVYNLTRKEEIAFEGKVGYFGGNLIMMIPKEGKDLSKVVNYLNSEEFKKNYMYAGRFKIGHRQIANALFLVS